MWVESLDMPFLRIERGPQAGTIFELVDGQTMGIGRERDNAVNLLDETASRHHSRVVCAGGACAIEDLGSANGTLVNGERVEKATLASGDVVRVGATTFTFEDGRRFQKDTVVIGPSDRSMSVVRSLKAPDADPLAAAPGEDTSKRYERLSRIVAAERGLRDAGTPESFLEGLWPILSREVRPDRGYFEVFDASGRPLVHRSLPAGLAGDRRVALSTAVRRAVLDRRESILIECTPDDDRFADRRSLAEAGVASALAVPVAHQGVLLGLLYLDRIGAQAEPLTAEDLRFVAGLADQVSPRLASTIRTKVKDEEIHRLQSELEGVGPVVGESPPFRKVAALVEKVASTDSSILLVGETGTGKEVVARTIHVRSRRAPGPFVAVNCAAIPEDLLESEFFGHEKGAFTGAHAAKKGKLQLASGGTIFLDEIGEIPVHLQSKLLRAFEERRFYPVGSDAEVSVDVRIVAATNRDLAAAIEDGSFRRDLYYRLSVVTIHLPPLRERAGDVRLLVTSFLARLTRSLGRRTKSVSAEAWKVLESYAWPGNVRELKNVVERAIVLSEGPEIGPEDLPSVLSSGGAPGSSLETKRILTLKEAEEMAIRRALEYCGWKKGEAVKLLGTSWPTLNKKIQEYGITPPNE